MRSKERNYKDSNWLHSKWCSCFLDLVSETLLVNSLVMFLFPRPKDCCCLGQMRIHVPWQLSMGEIAVLIGKTVQQDIGLWRTMSWGSAAGPIPLLLGMVTACAQLGLGRHCAFHTLLTTGSLTAEANESHGWGLGYFCLLQQWGKSSWLLCSGSREKAHRKELVPQVRNNHRKFYPGVTLKNMVWPVGRKQETGWKSQYPSENKFTSNKTEMFPIPASAFVVWPSILSLCRVFLATHSGYLFFVFHQKIDSLWVDSWSSPSLLFDNFWHLMYFHHIYPWNLSTAPSKPISTAFQLYISFS